jgi:holin-like protein
MLGGFTLLLLFQLAGEVLAKALALPVPGPVIGMALMLAFLILRGGVPAALDGAAHGLLAHLSILFVPGGVGVMLYLPQLRAEWLPIAGSLLLSTLLTLVTTALLLRFLMRHWGKKP